MVLSATTACWALSLTKYPTARLFSDYSQSVYSYSLEQEEEGRRIKRRQMYPSPWTTSSSASFLLGRQLLVPIFRENSISFPATKPPPPFKSFAVALGRTVRHVPWLLTISLKVGGRRNGGRGVAVVVGRGSFGSR